MQGTSGTGLEDPDGAETVGAAVQQQRFTMPSSRHSVLAKAARYRSEPERVNILVDEPLTAVVHGLHADHTVRQMGEGLICSCERFGRGEGQCAHVLAVEHHRSTAAANAAVADFGTALLEVLDGSMQPHADDSSLFSHVLLPFSDRSNAPDSAGWIQEVSRAGGGQLTLLDVGRRGGSGLSVAPTLLVLPLQVLGNKAEPSAWHSLVEQLVASIRVPLLLIPHSFVSRPPRSVLAAVDASRASAKVLEATAAVARATRATVITLHVGTNPPEYFANTADDLRWAGPKRSAEDAAECLRSGGIDAVGRAVLGHVPLAIQAIAQDVDADVLVLGTHAQGPRTRWLGRTVNAIVRSTERPVLLVRPDSVISDGRAPTGPASSDTAHSRDVHARLHGNTHRPATLFEERR